MNSGREAASAARGAGRTPDTRSGRLGAWRDAHLYSLLSSLGRMAARPWASLLTVGVLAIALALPLCLGLALQNLDRLSGAFRQADEVSLFLRPALSAAAAEAVAERVRERPDVADVQLRTPEQGLAEFRELAGFGEALAALDYNPLPVVLEVSPRAGPGAATLAETLRDLPEADFVQHDAEWRARLGAWLGFGQRATLLVAALLGMGALLVVGNTVRLDIQGRAEEIQIVQLLGATDGFVQRPFLYLGAWYGLFAGLGALAIALFVQWSLHDAVGALVSSYGSAFALRGLDAAGAGSVLLLAIALGWMGARLASAHQLRVARAGAR